MASPIQVGMMSLSKLWEVVKDMGSLVCCSPWGCKEDMTKQLNNNCLDFPASHSANK